MARFTVGPHFLQRHTTMAELPTVDQLRGGRAVLGIGGGRAERNFDEYGDEDGAPASPLQGLEAWRPRIRALAAASR